MSEKLKYSVKGLSIQLNESLYIQGIDIQEDIDRYCGDAYRLLELLFNITGLDGALSEELATLPDMEG